jgi:hypothetical protein
MASNAGILWPFVRLTPVAGFQFSSPVFLSSTPLFSFEFHRAVGNIDRIRRELPCSDAGWNYSHFWL